MILCRTTAQLERALSGQPVERTLVPTMGSLHAGHMSLVKYARQCAGIVMASVFINRHQFDDPQDFSDYPREEERDFERLREAEVDLVYVPDEQTVWGNTLPRLDSFDIPGLTDVLEGRHRPGHLPAVAAVVTRLFDQMMPTAAVFGEKDYQQLVLVRQLATRRRPPIQIVAAPVVREPDGLAMSSRNRRLGPKARRQAAELHRVLRDAARSLEKGNAAGQVEGEAVEALGQKGLAPDYVAVREAGTLRPLAGQGRQFVILAAAKLADVRLLDVVRGGPEVACYGLNEVTA